LKTNAKANTEQTEQNKKGIEIRKEISQFEQAIKEKLGQFYFNFYNNIPDIERQQKFRFLYLCCYLKYNDNRIQIKKDNGMYRLIKEGELMKLLQLKEREYYNTKKSLIDNQLISIDEDKNIIVNDNISFVGKVSKGTKEDYIRIFKESIKELYKQSLPREHKKLGLFIELLPYIHFKYNIICKNPTCNIIEDVDPLSPKEIGEILKEYSNKNNVMVKKKLLSIHIGNKEAVLYVERFNKKFFAVNPLIYYKGKRIEDLSFLIELFKL
jgi:hypothetical protein